MSIVTDFFEATVSDHFAGTRHFAWVPWDNAAANTVGIRCRTCGMEATYDIDAVRRYDDFEAFLAARPSFLREWVDKGLRRPATCWERLLLPDP